MDVYERSFVHKHLTISRENTLTKLISQQKCITGLALSLLGQFIREETSSTKHPVSQQYAIDKKAQTASAGVGRRPHPRFLGKADDRL